MLLFLVSVFFYKNFKPSQMLGSVMPLKKHCIFAGIDGILGDHYELSNNILFSSFMGSARGRWYKFNDNVVEEFDMNDETLEYECFGGEYRPKVYDQCESISLSSYSNTLTHKTYPAILLLSQITFIF